MKINDYTKLKAGESCPYCGYPVEHYLEFCKYQPDGTKVFSKFARCSRTIFFNLIRPCSHKDLASGWDE